MNTVREPTNPLDISIEGTYFKEISCYLRIYRMGNTIVKIDLSANSPKIRSDLARQVVNSIVFGSKVPYVADALLQLQKGRFRPFQTDVLSAVSKIPRGQTVTYAQIACIVGRPKAARAVGNVLSINPFVIIIPCHRVVAANGLGGYLFGSDIKRKLLELERTSKM